MDIVISDAAVGHTLVDIIVADPTRRDLVERAARRDLVAATDAERRNETHYQDRAAGTKIVPFALQTYGALSHRSDRECRLHPTSRAILGLVTSPTIARSTFFCGVAYCR